MIARGIFDPVKVSISTRGGDAQAIIFLGFQGKLAEDRLLPISGFPRVLVRGSQSGYQEK